MTSIEKHLSGYLGSPSHWWAYDAMPDIKVAQFVFAPFDDAVVLCTVGVSDHRLRQRSGQAIRQELVMACYERDAAEVRDLLFVLAKEIIDQHRALSQGEVVGPRGPIISGASHEALYCTPPSILPDGFEVVDTETGGYVVFVLLVPIAKAEAEFISRRGTAEFDRILEEEELDILDLGRGPIPAVLP